MQRIYVINDNKIIFFVDNLYENVRIFREHMYIE